MVAARGEGKKGEEFAEQLALWKAGPRQTDAYLKRMFPVSYENGDRKNQNAMDNRAKVRMILQSDSCKEICVNSMCRTSGSILLPAVTRCATRPISTARWLKSIAS